jgi:Putative Ig domain
MQTFARGFGLTLRVSAFAAIMTLAGCMGESSLTNNSAAASQVDANTNVITLTDTPPTEVVADSTYFYQPANTDDTSSADIRYSIANKPDWMNFDTGTGALSGVPSSTQVGVTEEITVTATAAAKTGSIGPFRITVKPHPKGTTATANLAPTIVGSPPTSATVNQAYAFSPTASDPEAQPLTFSIINRPSWATFDTATGRLTGNPTSGSVGKYSGIVIAVSDGTNNIALPTFSIDVVAAMVAVNPAPTIGGTPITTATAGTAYSFAPRASDVNGDPLTFSIQNKPTWALFNAATGQLYGTPTAAGAASNIVISVSDGTTTASLPAFSITVTSAVVASATGSALLSWSAPITNTDGSALTNLAGYHVYYGKDPANLTRVDLAGSGNLQFQATQLDPGVWYFTISAYNSTGVESAQPAVLSTSIT